MTNHVAALVLAICQITASNVSSPCDLLHGAKKETYGFRPSQLKQADREEKSRAMDKFWEVAKRQGSAGVSCIETMLNEEKDDGFFLFDGAVLLYSLDQSEASVAVVRDAVLRSSLTEVDPAQYVSLVLDLSHRGVDVGPLAMKYLTFPQVDTYLPQHAMQLDRLGGGIILFGSMQPSQNDKYLPTALSSGAAQTRDAAAMLLAFNMTEESLKTLRSLPAVDSLTPDTRKRVEEITHYTPLKPLPPPKFSREQVLRIIHRIPHTKEEYEALQPEYEKHLQEQETKRETRKLSSKELAEQTTRDIEEGEPFFGIAGHKRFIESAIQTLTEADLADLREARRESLGGVSDEALDEYFAYTSILLGVVNRLDLYREFRSR